MLHDVKYAARALARNPGFSLVAIVTLGLGIGANAAVFSAIDALLLNPLPYEEPNRLLLVKQSAPAAGRADTGVSIKEYFDYREASTEFESLVEYHQMSFDLLRRGEPDRVDTGVVSHDFFAVMGVRPLLGRDFRPEDDREGAQAVLLLSHRYWVTRFASDPGVVGQYFEMNDRPHLVIGVLPDVPLYPVENDVYMPVLACPFRAAAEKRIPENRRVFSILSVFGRLKAGVTPEAANTHIGEICGRFTRDNPAAYRTASGFRAATQTVHAALTVNARPMLLVLVGTAGLVLLLACANVANLTLGRLLRRDRELALRTALGLPRPQLFRQLLTESTLLALLGGLVGLGIAASTMSLLRTFLRPLTARADEIVLAPEVLAFTFAISVVTGVLFGTIPALSSTRIDLAETLKQGGRGSGQSPQSRRLQELLVVAQVAVSVILLVGAGLLIASFVRLRQVDPGYRAEGVLSAQASGNFSRYRDAQSLLRIYLPLLERLRSLPGVQFAAITNGVPMTATAPQNIPLLIEGIIEDDPDRRPTTDARIASTDYFSALGVPTVGGRVFTELDHETGTPVAVINQASARLWKGRDPVGTRVSIDGGKQWRTVVGVVGDIRQFGLSSEIPAQVYVPMRQVAGAFPGRVVLRTSGDPMTYARAVTDAVHALDPNMPVEQVATLESLQSDSMSTPRTVTTLLAGFAVLALLVTLTGVTGVLAINVTQRTREFGVRMALGESRADILRRVLRRGIGLVAVGVVIGMVGAVGATRVLASYLFGTAPVDPITWSSVAVLFLAAAVVACLGPALRATKVDPLKALQTE